MKYEGQTRRRMPRYCVKQGNKQALVASVKIAVFAPMPRARVKIATRATRSMRRSVHLELRTDQHSASCWSSALANHFGALASPSS